MKRKYFVGGLAAALVLFCSAQAFMQDSTNDAERAAREAMDKFYEAFNKADNDELQKYMNFPHIMLTGNGAVSVSQEKWTMNFDTMRSREGWAKSTIVSAKACLVTDNKVYFDTTFSRHKPDGTVYQTTRGMWVITKKDGHWGVQMRGY